MPKGHPNPCKVEGCEQRPVKGALLCTEHLGERRRCEGEVKVRDEDGEDTGERRRCRKAAMAGLTVCEAHGGSRSREKAISARTAPLTAMQRFVQPYEGDLDPVSAFEGEFRRTVGRIKWLEGQLSNLRDETELIWGVSKTEQIQATEFAGTNTTYEARIHQFEEMLRWERKHFLDLEKVWITAGLEEKRLSIMQSQIDYTYTLIAKALDELGHDLGDPQVQTTLLRLFEKEALNEATP